jgi:hypothetical protein
MKPRVLGLDIGGANLKAATAEGYAASRPFALWRYPDRLVSELLKLLSVCPQFDRLAVTMTGELCDCFETKSEGVLHILDAIDGVAGGRPIEVWTIDGSFVPIAAARKDPLRAAASNWLALASYCGRLSPIGLTLLIDIGSTTCDLIPIQDGIPIATGRTDTERLESGELVYTGVRRTPLCSLLGSAFAAEFFATTHDVYLYLEMVPEEPDEVDTADGRPATRPFAAGRLARMACADRDTFPRERIVEMAQLAFVNQRRIISQALERVVARQPGPPACIVTAGTGEFLANAVIAGSSILAHVPRVSLSSRIGSTVSAAAPAFAVAVLLAELRESLP